MADALHVQTLLYLLHMSHKWSHQQNHQNLLPDSEAPRSSPRPKTWPSGRMVTFAKLKTNSLMIQLILGSNVKTLENQWMMKANTIPFTKMNRLSTYWPTTVSLEFSRTELFNRFKAEACGPNVRVVQQKQWSPLIASESWVKQRWPNLIASVLVLTRCWTCHNFCISYFCDVLLLLFVLLW